MESFLNKIKHKRKEKNLTLLQLSKILGCSKSYLCEVENGVAKNISFELGLKISNVLDIQIRPVSGTTSDGYHTFDELYDFRMVYNAALFNEWGRQGKYDVHKSERHNDGELCFGGGWFIVSAMLPTGLISNHYPVSKLEQFADVPTVYKASFVYDGHTSKDVLDRLKGLNSKNPNNRRGVR